MKTIRFISSYLPLLLLILYGLPACRTTGTPSASTEKPNMIVVLTDDQTYDALGASGNKHIHTPHINRMARRGVRLTQSFAVLPLCSPSRAAVLTGRYGRANGVDRLNQGLDLDERTFAKTLKQEGYRTALVGKWHLKKPPVARGFDFHTFFVGNGRYYRRKVIDNGEELHPKKHVDEYCVDRSIDFLKEASEKDQPFVLFHNTQLPHMNHNLEWNARGKTKKRYDPHELPVPESWDDDLSGKPPYLKKIRNRTQALKYGYDKKINIRKHKRDYYAVITEMDAALGRLFEAIRDRNLLKQNTYLIFMSDNGWLLGEHRMTSKVLPYHPSLRVPIFVVGPGIKPRLDQEHIALNIDIAPTLLDLAGLEVPERMHGRSLRPIANDPSADWRSAFVYECLGGYGGSKPMLGAYDGRWKLLYTYESETDHEPSFTELYDLKTDPAELSNLVDTDRGRRQIERLNRFVEDHRRTRLPDGE